MNTENKICIIAWLPICVITLIVFAMLSSKLSSCFYHSWRTETIFFASTTLMLLIETFAIAIVGNIVFVGYEYGSKLFWKRSAVWYAVYLAITIVALICEGIRWDLFSDSPFIFFALFNCLYPLVLMLELVLVINVAKWIKALIVKIKLNKQI